MKLIQMAFNGRYWVPESVGFYEATEGVLGVSFRPRGRFYYSVEGEKCSLELDGKGELAHIEVRQPKENWLILPRLSPPHHLFRSAAAFPVATHQDGEEYLTNLRQDILCVEFSSEPAWRSVEIAESITVEISADYQLLRLWILKMVDDFGNRKELAWLKAGSLYTPHPI